MNALIAFQATIATTGTAQQLPSNPVARSVTITASSGNSAPVAIGNAASVTEATGFILDAGQSITLASPGGNTGLWAVGTAGNVLSVIGA